MADNDLTAEQIEDSKHYVTITSVESDGSWHVDNWLLTGDPQHVTSLVIRLLDWSTKQEE
jgi:hypothetical protein